MSPWRYRSPAAGTAPVFFGMVVTDRGDVVELLDAKGNPFAAYRYDAWGNPLGEGNVAGTTGLWTKTTSLITDINLADAIATRQPLRYATYCFDSESGMYYLSSRHYDPATRQFLSKDLSRNDGEQSAYQYCLGNPIKNVDPTGLTPMGYAQFLDKYPKELKVYGEDFMYSRWQKYLGWQLVREGRAREMTQRFPVFFAGRGVLVLVGLKWIVMDGKILDGSYSGSARLMNSQKRDYLNPLNPYLGTSTATAIRGVASELGTGIVVKARDGSLVPVRSSFKYTFAAGYKGNGWYGLLGPDLDDGTLGGTITVGSRGVVGVRAWDLEDTSISEVLYEQIGGFLQFYGNKSSTH